MEGVDRLLRLRYLNFVGINVNRKSGSRYLELQISTSFFGRSSGFCASIQVITGGNHSSENSPSADFASSAAATL